MEEGRKEYFNLTGGHQKSVPVGIWLDRIKVPKFEEIEKHALVFMGHVTQKQGVQNVLEAIPKIIKKIPDFKFLVIGGGPYLCKLKEQVEQLEIQKYVTFTGYIEKHEDLEKMVSKCTLAIALYNKCEENGVISFTHFADPAKLKTYLACGLPVLVTDVPYNAKEIVGRGCGEVITADPESVTVAVLKLMENENKLKEYRNNALEYSKQFHWNMIFGTALEEVLK
jgi:glycosyltransferase involved in cell wall biosynthesis